MGLCIWGFNGEYVKHLEGLCRVLLQVSYFLVTLRAFFLGQILRRSSCGVSRRTLRHLLFEMEPPPTWTITSNLTC